jgi:hypothetical protein
LDANQTEGRDDEDGEQPIVEEARQKLLDNGVHVIGPLDPPHEEPLDEVDRPPADDQQG